MDPPSPFLDSSAASFDVLPVPLDIKIKDKQRQYYKILLKLNKFEELGGSSMTF